MNGDIFPKHVSKAFWIGSQNGDSCTSSFDERKTIEIEGRNIMVHANNYTYYSGGDINLGVETVEQ